MTRKIEVRVRVLWAPKRNLDWGPPRVHIPEHWWVTTWDQPRSSWREGLAVTLTVPKALHIASVCELCW